jgi:hypothetical protein
MPTRRVAYCKSSAPHDADRQLVIRVRNELIPSTLFARASQCGSVRAKGRPDGSIRECPAVLPEALARLSRGQPRRRCPAVGHQRRRDDHPLHLRLSRSKGPQKEKRAVTRGLRTLFWSRLRVMPNTPARLAGDIHFARITLFSFMTKLTASHVLTLLGIFSVV